MWGIVLLMFAWGSAGALAESSVMGRLYWCSALCMCEANTNTEVQCFQEDDVYQLLGFSKRSVSRLRKADWNLETKVDWCNELCLCNIQTGKEFRCSEPEGITQLIINRIGTTYFLPLEGEGEIRQETERSVDEDEDPSLDQEREHTRQAERRRNRKNRKQKKNLRKHRKHSEDSEQEAEILMTTTDLPTTTLQEMTSTTLPTTPRQDTTPSTLTYNHAYNYEEDEVEEFEVNEQHEPLPKHEAVAASPAVTAMQSPTRKLLPFTTAESHTPRELEGLSPRVQPVVEVPKEKKTMASMVSQDLDDLGSTVRNIKNDVMLNQRILLVTVAVAGVAMLGVVILAILSCTRRRQQAAITAKKRDANKEGNHSPKINLEEAW